MANKTVCDICNNVILDGQNAGKRQPIFSHGRIEVQTKVRIENITDPDLCLPCLKKAISEA